MSKSPVIIRGLTHGKGGVSSFLTNIRGCGSCELFCATSWYPRRNQRYSLSQMTLALADPILLGLGRIETLLQPAALSGGRLVAALGYRNFYDGRAGMEPRIYELR